MCTGVEVQGQSAFLTPQITGGHGRWAQQGEAQMVTSRCLPSLCFVVRAVLGRQHRRGQRGSVLRELAVWGSALSNGRMVTLTEAGFCAIVWGLATMERFVSPLSLH